MSEELKAAQARIACLEGEIAKRDARIVELESAAESLRLSRDYHREQENEYRRRWAGLYAAPVSESKAQGVVLTDEELCSIRNQVACNEVRLDDDSRTICVKHGRALEAAVLARLNAAQAAPAADAGATNHD